MSVTPVSASCSTTTSRIARSPTGISGFGSTEVYGARRVPRPPASTTAFTRPVRTSALARAARLSSSERPSASALAPIDPAAIVDQLRLVPRHVSKRQRSVRAVHGDLLAEEDCAERPEEDPDVAPDRASPRVQLVDRGLLRQQLVHVIVDS